MTSSTERDGVNDAIFKEYEDCKESDEYNEWWTPECSKHPHSPYMQCRTLKEAIQKARAAQKQDDLKRFKELIDAEYKQ